MTPVQLSIIDEPTAQQQAEIERIKALQEMDGTVRLLVDIHTPPVHIKDIISEIQFHTERLNMSLSIITGGKQ